MRAPVEKAQRINPALILLAMAILFSRPVTLARGNQNAEQAGSTNETNQSTVRRLEVGQPVELAGGESHSYEIALTEGQYLKVVLDQKGMDVLVTLSGPDGKQIMEVDNSTGLQGSEQVEQVVKVTGSYRLIVQSRQKGASAGRYEIRVVELRAATEDDRALEEARNLRRESERLYRAGRYDEARPLGERALAIREKALGPDHPAVADSLNNLAELYRLKGDYAKAEPLQQRALAVREKALGSDQPEVANSLNNLANLYYSKGDYAKAEPLWQRSLAIREKALGPDHPDVAASLHNLAILYRLQGDYGKAEPLSQRSLAIREKALGPDHPLVAQSLINLAIIYSDKGDYAKAEPLYQRALAIREKALGPDHPGVADSVTNLANLYGNKGDYAKAEPLQQRALAIREKALGPDHPDVANSLNNLAELYRLQGDYAKAEPLSQRSLAIREKALGPDHPDVAQSLINLAVIYGEKGDYAKAEPLSQRSLTIREKALGPDHPLVANSLNNLAIIHRHQGEYAKAEPLYQRALAILEKALGPDHPLVAHPLNNLAELYREKGDYAKAEPLNQRSLAILEKALGPNHPDVARSLNNLADLYREKGDYAKAEPLYQRSLAILEKALGPDHPLVAEFLNNFTRLYAAKNDTASAITYQSRASRVTERNISLNVATGSERQKLAYLATVSNESDLTVSLHLQYAPKGPDALRLSINTVLRRKGRALDAMTDSISALRRRFNPQDRQLLDQLTEARSRLAKLVLGGPGNNDPAKHRAEVKLLEEQVEKLESDISRLSLEFRVQSQPVTLEAVQSAIPRDAALVEFASYRPFNARYKKESEAFGEPRYVAYILRRQGDPEWVELGEVKPIDESVDLLRKALRNPRRADVRRLARAVDAKVMMPVRKLLGQTRRLLVSPDGALNLVPFAALVDERNRYLVSRYSISYLTSGRDLLRLKEKIPSKQGAMIIADPDFGEAEKWDGVTAGQTSSKGELADLYFERLKATEEEARELKQILPEAVVLTRSNATEAALKATSSPRLLHIATHGFFLEGGKQVEAGSAGEQTRVVVRRRANEPTKAEDDPSRLVNPLLRSGLGLAGANLRSGGEGNDGIVTALEAAGLDLWGTKLVVLSACDTGVGEVRSGEGVYGLRRALVLAGSESQMMSLWPVSDRGTRELMVEYYRRLKAGEGRSEALRRVQLKMLASKNRKHPFYWASFIQSGEWANLDGKRVD
jgi:CHAT domain-containing protein/Tfp pilus assembly protein PilF